jgi:hypothetical protein
MARKRADGMARVVWASALMLVGVAAADGTWEAEYTAAAVTGTVTVTPRGGAPDLGGSILPDSWWAEEWWGVSCPPDESDGALIGFQIHWALGTIAGSGGGSGREHVGGAAGTSPLGPVFGSWATDFVVSGTAIRGPGNLELDLWVDGGPFSSTRIQVSAGGQLTGSYKPAPCPEALDGDPCEITPQGCNLVENCRTLPDPCGVHPPNPCGGSLNWCKQVEDCRAGERPCDVRDVIPDCTAPEWEDLCTLT